MGQMMAAATLVTIPVFIIVMFIQKQLAAGLTIGGISKQSSRIAAIRFRSQPEYSQITPFFLQQSW